MWEYFFFKSEIFVGKKKIGWSNCVNLILKCGVFELCVSFFWIKVINKKYFKFVLIGLV